jgi:hypothetical protein
LPHIELSLFCLHCDTNRQTETEEKEHRVNRDERMTVTVNWTKAPGISPHCLSASVLPVLIPFFLQSFHLSPSIFLSPSSFLLPPLFYSMSFLEITVAVTSICHTPSFQIPSLHSSSTVTHEHPLAVTPTFVDTLIHATFSILPPRTSSKRHAVHSSSSTFSTSSSSAFSSSSSPPHVVSPLSGLRFLQ